jgi:hypothetical protein
MVLLALWNSCPFSYTAAHFVFGFSILAPYFAQLIYLPAEFFAGKVRDTTGFSGFNGFEAISSSWHFVLEPTGTRRHLTDSEWNSTQAAMRADALSEAKAVR